MTDRRVQPLIAEYLRMISVWRRQRYQDDLRDRRNLQSADALEQFADFVLTLPSDDQRILDLDRLGVQGEQFFPGQQASYEIGRFHFYNTDTGFDAFLDRVVELATADAGEHGRFGGQLPAGDDPWE